MITRIGKEGPTPDPEDQIRQVLVSAHERELYYKGKDPDETDKLIAAYEAMMKDEIAKFAPESAELEAVEDLATLTKAEAWVDLIAHNRTLPKTPDDAQRELDAIEQSISAKSTKKGYNPTFYHFKNTYVTKLNHLHERVDVESHSGMAKWRTADMLTRLVAKRTSTPKK